MSGTPGHSSFPPPESAIGILAAAVAKLEENPQPSHLGKGPESATFKHLAPHVCRTNFSEFIIQCHMNSRFFT